MLTSFTLHFVYLKKMINLFLSPMSPSVEIFCVIELTKIHMLLQIWGSWIDLSWFQLLQKSLHDRC